VDHLIVAAIIALADRIISE